MSIHWSYNILSDSSPNRYGNWNKLLYLFLLLYIPRTNPTHLSPKPIEGPICLIVRDMDGNAHAENSSVIISSGGRKEYKWRSNLVFSSRNLTHLVRDFTGGDVYFLDEVRGVIVHELTHSWQWSCSGMPDGLTEGTFSS